MEKIIDTKAQTLSRKQFLAMLGSALAGILFSQFFLSSKQSYVRAPNAYGNSNYGNRG